MNVQIDMAALSYLSDAQELDRPRLHDKRYPERNLGIRDTKVLEQDR